MSNIVLIEQEIPHYRIGVFNALSDALDGRLLVCSPKNDDSKFFLTSENECIRFGRSEIKAGTAFGGRLFVSNLFDVFKTSRRPDVVILRHVVRNPYIIPFLLYCRFLGLPTVVWGQGFSRKRSFRPFLNVFDSINLVIVKLSNSYVGYSDAVVQQLARFEKPGKLFVARNTLNLKTLDGIMKRLQDEGKASVRERLGLVKNNYIIFVGRLQKRKRVNFLINAFQEVNNKNSDTGLLIVGDGPERRELEALAGKFETQDVSFLGALDFRESSPYMFSADVMAIPGWLGLAVNHGFYFGLPVVTCDETVFNEGHPPEIEWLKHKVNGFISSANSTEQFADDLIWVMRNREKLGAAARRYYEEQLSIDAMIEGFLKAIKRSKNKLCNP